VNASTFGTVEEATASLGGRWLLLVRIGEESRLYPDATGTKSAFYTVLENGAVWAASQPSLLAEALGVERDEESWRRFHSHATNASSWPGEITPYRGVRQLLPNHYLDLRSGDVHRFWPKAPVAPQPLEQAARYVADRLHGAIAATVARGPVAMPLTGGYDSRTLFASAGSLRSTLLFFSIRGFHIPHHDFDLPKALARKFGVQLRIVPPQRYPQEFWDVLQQNVSRMWWDVSEYMMYTFGSLGVRFVLHGMVSEIARCFYYEDGKHPEYLTPESLANIARYQGHPMAIEAFSKWLAGVPGDSGINTLDLFYWEHRAGNWASMMCTAFDTLVEPIAPYNCRELLETALGVEVAHRRAPYALHREVCRVGAAATLEVPFNTSWLDDIHEAVRRWVPWRVQNAYRQARLRIAGFR
jgi:hypothetical protein